MSLDTATFKTYTTISELASEWRVSIAHIHNLINRKQLPAHKVGARYIINRSAAQEFLQKNATASMAA